jgi:molybdate transport system substrate-binding protein
MATLAGCAPKAAPPQPAANQQPVTLTVSAAASLNGYLQKVDALYTQANPNVTITPTFGASGTLESQIENGAPSDVFISAAEKQMNELQKKQLIATDTRADLLANTLVLIVPSDSTASITSFQDLATAKVKSVAIGEPKSVPAGEYALKALTELKIAGQVKPKEVMGSDVRTVLADVETGNVDAGLVYLTDAKTTDKVKVVATAPADINAQITYPVAVIKASGHADAAKAYVSFLESEQVKALWQQFGFTVK